MTIKDGKIIEATESELIDYWLSRGWCDIYPYREYQAKCELTGTIVIGNTPARTTKLDVLGIN